MNIAANEIEWRELLVKRLKSAQAVLKRDAAKEEKQRTEAKQLAADGYKNYDEAHDAYGWGYITEKQLLTIEAIFYNHDNQALTALRRINEIIGNVEGEISMLKHDPEYRKEIIGDMEEIRLAKSARNVI